MSYSLLGWGDNFAELIWEDGQVAVHGLAPPRDSPRPTPPSPWDTPPSGDTLQSIVDQAAALPKPPPSHPAAAPCFHNPFSPHAASNLCLSKPDDPPISAAEGPGRTENTASGAPSSKDSASEARHSECVGNSQRKARKKDKKSRGQSSLSTKRSLVHNQSERKRRDKINEKMKTLQKLVPNSSKTDKASMLDEVIEYLKQLQAQVQMMGRFSMSPIMVPAAQLQMPVVGVGSFPVVSPFLPAGLPWEGLVGDRFPATGALDPMSAAFFPSPLQ